MVKDALLNLDAVVIEKDSNLGQLISELKKHKNRYEKGRIMQMHSDYYGSYADVHTDVGNYGDNYSDSDRQTHSDDGCFITTATLNSRGVLDDNCYELTLARLFRDNYVKEKYPELLTEYRDIAPKIIKNIDTRKNKLQVYDHIWSDYLSKCLYCIEDGDFEAATQLYKDMVLELKGEFLCAKTI